MAHLTEEDYERLCGEEGIVKVMCIVDSQPIVSWDNSGSGQNFNKYWCYVCLASYFNWEVRDYCRRTHSVVEQEHPLQMVA